MDITSDDINKIESIIGHDSVVSIQTNNFEVSFQVTIENGNDEIIYYQRVYSRVEIEAISYLGKDFLVSDFVYMTRTSLERYLENLTVA